MDKIKILVACHKPGPVRHDDVYTPIHVGRAISKYKEEMSDMIGDDTGDNISDKNPFYSEMTAQYWAWKNLHDVEYIGFCHYRRFFNIEINKSNVESLFRNKDVILLGYRNLEMVERSLLRSVNLENITIFMKILKRMYPEYEQTVLDYLWNNKIHGKNMLICRKDLFDQYCEWIFGILNECEKHIRLSPYTRERRVFAYLAEYFMPVFFIHKKCIILSITSSENNNQFRMFIKNVLRSVFFFPSKLFPRKPKSFEDYYSKAVLLGLESDGIIQAIDK